METRSKTTANILGIEYTRPFIVSGPCGAESQEQVESTVLALGRLGTVNLVRAGIWKPRTHPNSFEGAGNEGLKWLKDAGIAAGLPVTVEVANAKHVEAALKIGIDVLWIGARSTVNPFVVQEIADALQGVDVPVMVKNPVNPDIELWIGAFERFLRAGISRIAAIHRGFSSYEKTMYRNRPNWEIPIEFRRRMPGIPMICDPSHISGNRTLLQAVSQTALDLNFDGLMIESHINPDKALSDSKQQITPEILKVLLNNLICRTQNIEDVTGLRMIEDFRQQIDKLDYNILDIIAKRMKIAKDIGQFKKDHNITILQSMRWDEIVETRMMLGVNKELTKEFVLKLFELIHQEAIENQSKVMNS